MHSPNAWYDNVLTVVERSRNQEVTEMTGMQASRKCAGDQLWIELYVISTILKVIHSDIGSQCSVSCSVGMMCPSVTARQ